jgi:transcriptional regulator with XRE-family HTH domain
MSTFGARLKAARLQAGLSQEQLGLLAGFEVESASARMNRYERGTRAPAVALVERIGMALKLPIAYFYATDDDEAALLVAFYRMPPSARSELLAEALKRSDQL